MTRPYAYTPFYCEENVWHLGAADIRPALDKKVVFISNPLRQCLMWGQRAARPGQPVQWDYHVILLARAPTEWQVWDLDSIWGLPVSVTEYISRSFVTTRPQLMPYLPMFQVLAATTYREIFSSDRSHMRTKTGQWLKPPPPWPAIIRPDQPHFRYLTEMRPTAVSTLMDLATFRVTFGAGGEF